MRDFGINYILPFLCGVLISETVLQFTDNFGLAAAISFPLAFLFGLFIYPKIAKFLRG